MQRRVGFICVALAAPVLLGMLLSLDLRGADEIRVAANDASTPAKPTRSGRGGAPDFGIPQVQYINSMIRQGWADNGLTPSPAATDAEWCRRVYLDILGRIPDVEELNAFQAERSADKKAKLVNLLLSDDPRYIEDYARNWTTIWTNLLIGRTGGTEQRTLVNRDGMQQYLRRSFLRNKPYDALVLELVSATGNTKPGDEKFNGAVNFLVGMLDENAAQATAKTAQVFLGLQVQCTQCHNHPFNDWKQNQFWEMNAFFRQTTALRRFGAGRDIESAELANQDFAGEDASRNPSEARIYYELRNSRLVSALPVFVDGTSLEQLHGPKGNSGYLEEMDRRSELAKLIVKSEYMPKAIVNRMWGHFFGYGFTKPVDDLGPHNPPTHPELLDQLSKDFVKHSYDLKQLIRWIVLSEPYSLSSKFGRGNKADDPSLGEKPQFSHYYVRQMQAEELYESLITATKAARGSYEEQEQAKARWLSDIVQTFGTDDGGESTTFNGTITQALMMFNGDLIKQATSIDKGSFLYSLAYDAKKDNGDKINHLYFAALARKPTRDELEMANKLLIARKGNVVAALQDIWWVLLNSSEFILNH